MPPNTTQKIAPEPALPLASGTSDDVGANIVRWLFPAYIFLILVGFFALRAPGVMPAGNDLNPDRAVFTSVNAATLTGFQLSMHPSIFSLPGKVMLLLLTIFGTLFTLIVGGMAAKRILRLPWPDGRIIAAALIIQGVVLFLGALTSGAGGPEKAIGGMVQTSAAWGNSGLYVDVAPGATDLYTHLVLLPLSILGGLGLVVLLEVFDALFHRRPLSRHSRVVLQMTAALFLIGMVVCLLLQLIDMESIGWRNKESMPGGKETWFEGFTRLRSQIITNALIMSVNSRTAGMNLIPIAYPRAMVFFVMILMLIGASPAGTGGGLKTTTVYEIVAAPWRVLRGRTLSRTFGIAGTWVGLYLIALAFFQSMLLWAEPQMPGDRVLFITISALSNVGLSHDVISMTRSSLLLVSAAMFFGRITPLLILWWMVDTTHDADLVVA
ncbi:MAG: potassium transporter KtrB [Phycisphaerales bacterium]|nr:potassium transporter KtrB [Phycisphaerales bacterium]